MQQPDDHAPLSEQIAAFAEWMRGYESDGLQIAPAALGSIIAIFEGMAAQARQQEAIIFGDQTQLAAAIEEEAAAVQALAEGIARTNAMLRAADEGKLAFLPSARRRPPTPPRRGDVTVDAALAILAQAHDDGGDCA